jgi:hypothetical protein
MVKKTKADAEKFADSLTDKTEAEMFLKWFAEGDEEKVRGHFPAFYGKVVDAKPPVLNDDDFYAELQSVAKHHDNLKAVADRDGWLEGRGEQTPESVYYAEYPEHAPKKGGN